MKISNWSIVGGILSIAFLIISTIRYYFLYPDMDKWFMDLIISCLGLAVSWLFNKQLQQGYAIESIEDYLDDKRLEKEVNEV